MADQLIHRQDTAEASARAALGPSRLFRPEEAADWLGLSRSTLFDLLKRGELRSLRIGASRRIPADALAEYVARLTAEQAATSAA